MKHTFRNEKPKTFEILPEGDYLLEVIKADSLISQGAKTRGSSVLELTVKSVEHGTTFSEKLIAHPSCDWKIDLFVNCFNFASQIGEEVDLDPDNCIGRRGWCKVIQVAMTKSDGTPWIGQNGKQGIKNEIAVFYTDKEKFPRQVLETAAVPTGAEKDPWEV